MSSPKIEIIDHFDSLINRIDIDIDQCLEKYKQEQVLSELDCFHIEQRNVRGQKYIHLDGLSQENIKKETVDEWSESTKVIDYLNRIRMRTIEGLRKAQEETLEYYKQNSTQFKSKSMEEIRRGIFKEKFHFQLLYKKEYTKPWVFNLYTFDTDFYISSTDINLLE